MIWNDDSFCLVIVHCHVQWLSGNLGRENEVMRCRNERKRVELRVEERRTDAKLKGNRYPKMAD